MAARVTSFEFAAGPDFVGASVCNINHTTHTIQYPGVAALPLAVIPLVHDAVIDLAGQEAGDGDADTERTIYNPDGTTAVVVRATVVAGVVTGISPGSVSFPPDKVVDLFNALEDLDVSGLLA